MNPTEDEKLKAAYALNLCTVSVSQIIDYNDINILQQEYDAIMNNLNLEEMPKDDALKEVIFAILDEITSLKQDAGDQKIVEMEYQHKLKNAVWNAIPNMGAIFATSDPVAMGLTLATQVGIGYMNYRRSKAENELAYEESKWQIQRNRMEHLHGLQKQLFATAWELAKSYQFPDQYRLTEARIKAYNAALVEPNPFRRYHNLDAMKQHFEAYPLFWYQLGSTANSIFRNSKTNAEQKEHYQGLALEHFKKYEQLNRFKLLRSDLLTSAWALEYLELQGLDRNNDPEEARKLIKIAEASAGDALDVLELCAFAYLRIEDTPNAARLFHILVNKRYNTAINTQILSCLYIKMMAGPDADAAKNARFNYGELPKIVSAEYRKYILPAPPEGTDFSHWSPNWNTEDSIDDILERQMAEAEQKKAVRAENRQKACAFFQWPITVVHRKKDRNVANLFLAALNENLKKLDLQLPSPQSCEYTDYRKSRQNYERSGEHIILIGDSQEAKQIYKGGKNDPWEYNELGMRYLSSGNKTVLLTQPLKNEEIDAFIALLKRINEKLSMDIPDVESARHTFLQECMKEFEDLDMHDPFDVATAIVSTVVGSPLLLAGQAVENVGNMFQRASNLANANKLRYLQYAVLIYTYLDDQHAIVDP